MSHTPTTIIPLPHSPRYHDKLSLLGRLSPASPGMTSLGDASQLGFPPVDPHESHCASAFSPVSMMTGRTVAFPAPAFSHSYSEKDLEGDSGLSRTQPPSRNSSPPMLGVVGSGRSRQFTRPAPLRVSRPLLPPPPESRVGSRFSHVSSFAAGSRGISHQIEREHEPVLRHEFPRFDGATSARTTPEVIPATLPPPPSVNPPLVGSAPLACSHEFLSPHVLSTVSSQSDISPSMKSTPTGRDELRPRLPLLDVVREQKPEVYGVLTKSYQASLAACRTERDVRHFLRYHVKQIPPEAFGSLPAASIPLLTPDLLRRLPPSFFGFLTQAQIQMFRSDQIACFSEDQLEAMSDIQRSWFAHERLALLFTEKPEVEVRFFIFGPVTPGTIRRWSDRVADHHRETENPSLGVRFKKYCVPQSTAGKILISITLVVSVGSLVVGILSLAAPSLGIAAIVGKVGIIVGSVVHFLNPAMNIFVRCIWGHQDDPEELRRNKQRKAVLSGAISVVPNVLDGH